MSIKSKKLNCGVIGVGRLGYRHATSIMVNTKANLITVADPIKEARERAIQDFECETYEDYKDLLKDSRIEAVIITAPTKQHYTILMEAIAAGKSIFVEKPITYTVEEAEKIREEVEKNNIYLQVGFMRRFDPGYLAAKRMIDKGELGNVIYIQDCQRDPSGPPKHFVPESGGLFVDMGIHDLDCLRWLTGKEIISVYAQGTVSKHEYLREMNDIDQGQILITFADNTLGMIEVSRNGNEIYDVRTEVVGTKSSVNIGQVQYTPYAKVDGKGITYDIADWCLGRFEKSYELEMDAFIDGVVHGKESPVNAYDGMIALKLAEISTKSYQNKCSIDIDID